MNDQGADRQIEQWSGMFSGIYSGVDKKRTPEQIWIATMSHTSSIGEAIRRVAFESLLMSAAHTFCWLCSFVNQCNALEKHDVFSLTDSLCGIVCLKYPGACGYCRGIPCKCDPAKMDKEKNKAAEYVDLLSRRKLVLSSFEGYCLADCMRVFNDIYGGRIHIQTLESIGFHFLEEIGEAAVAVRRLGQLRRVASDTSTGIDDRFLTQLVTVEGIVAAYSEYGVKPDDIDHAAQSPEMLRARLVDAKIGLLIEIGDAFSWFCAVLNKLAYISEAIFEDPLKHPDAILQPLDCVLASEYLDSSGRPRCPTCREPQCECVFFP